MFFIKFGSFGPSLVFLSPSPSLCLSPPLPGLPLRALATAEEILQVSENLSIFLHSFSGPPTAPFQWTRILILLLAQICLSEKFSFLLCYFSLQECLFGSILCFQLFIVVLFGVDTLILPINSLETLRFNALNLFA